MIHDSARGAQWERKSTAPESPGARARYLPEPGRRKCDPVASALASEGCALSRTLPDSGKGVRHSSDEEERASEDAKSFEAEVATAPAHVLREEVAFHCGKEADGSGGGGELSQPVG